MTRVMPKGSNIPLAAVDAVRAVLRWRVAPGGPDVDVVALLLGANGQVRGDEDFVFYNQPRHPTGRVRHRSKTRRGEDLSDTLDIDLTQLPPEIERVVVGGAAEGGHFGQLSDLCVLLYDIARGPDAEPLARFDITDATPVGALLCGEIYRRSGGWKFRAIGQGYSSGLGGLAKDFGVTVDDDDPTEPPPADPQQPPSKQAPSLPSPSPQSQAEPQPQPQHAAGTTAGTPVSLPGQAAEYPRPPAYEPLLPEPPDFALPPQGPQFLPVD
ncbi:TerD family protein [Streptacidiphilus sp. P02-A3a]|uniref:TerD family protein n=1 Tax=Streptacidiphilus sp. P02-A3a TaxID=2704468 RepID=UPI0015F8F35E|nr:TerD family protein [Streptacidiphilus sp. P02-A3a]QMU68271.1 TerD family protein [Streptacidiphilus sp. P02-A3a]